MPTERRRILYWGERGITQAEEEVGFLLVLEDGALQAVQECLA